MKKIKILLFFICLFTALGVNANQTICDSGNLNFNGTTVSEICNGGYMTGSIEGVESFTGSFTNLQAGFWGTNNNYNKKLNPEKHLPVGEFNTNKKTKVKNVNPHYTIPTGYMGIDFNYVKNLDLEHNLPLGFFDSHKTTYIKKNNPKYTVPVGFLGNAVIKKKGGGGGATYIKQYYYKEYFEEVFRNNSSLAFAKSGYRKNEYNTFINNLLELLIGDNKDQYKIIDDVTKNRIKLYIEKDEDFKINLGLLIKNLRAINKAFEKASREEKIYVLKYYLSK